MPSKAIPYLKALLHLLCALPFLFLLQSYRNGSLANLPDPVGYIIHFTGDWALWILLADLAITPLRRLHASLGWLIRFRRLVGLWAFFYATLHLLTYVILFSGYEMATAIEGLKAHHYGEPFHQFALIWPAMLDDVQKRWFIQFGLAAWFILLLLAVTSPQRIMRWMGGKNWQRLHRGIYLAAIAAVTHYWLLVKTGVRTPLKVTLVLTVLLLARIVYSAMKRLRKPQRAATV